MAKQPVVLNGKPVGRVKAGWLLFKETWRYLMMDKELLAVPVITGVLNILLVGFIIGVAILVGSAVEGEIFENDVFSFALGFLLYTAGAFTLALAQAATVNTVYIRAHGGDATLGQSLKVAFSHWGSLLAWSLITATVGIVLRTISERSQILGKIITMLLGAAWAVMTYFVVPSMVVGKKSAFASIGDSTQTFKQTWGETMVSNISYGVILTLINVAAIITFVGLFVLAMVNGMDIIGYLLIALLVIWIVVMSLITSAMNAILRTLLYLYAHEQVMPQNFSPELIEKMFARNNPTPEQTFTPNSEATPRSFV